MINEDSLHLLDRAGVLTHPCDLDLLLFFVRHRHSLLSSETIAAFLGYEPRDIAEALEKLLAAELVSRTQTPAHAARLYVMTGEVDVEGWLGPLISLASTRIGRLSLRRVLVQRAATHSARTPATPPGGVERIGPRRLIPRRAEEEHGDTGG